MRFTTLALILFTCCGINCARGETITSFQGAFQFPTPAPGWSYSWNSGGPIGDPANYTPLMPNASGLYTVNGGAIPGSPPSSFLLLGLQSGMLQGHPGEGAAQSDPAESSDT